MTDELRVLIADDHALFREGLRRLLESESTFNVVGEAEEAGSVVQLAQSLKPDLVLLDLSMPHSSGLEVLESLIKKTPSSRVILLTAAITKRQVVQAMQLGARGIVLKESTSKTLVNAIRLVMEGQYWVAHECVSDLVEALREAMSNGPQVDKPKTFGLTRRELEVVNLVVAGYSNPEIARKCTISEQTVKHHISNIFDKVGVYNRVELALFAVSHQIAGELSS